VSSPLAKTQDERSGLLQHTRLLKDRRIFFHLTYYLIFGYLYARVFKVVVFGPVVRAFFI